MPEPEIRRPSPSAPLALQLNDLDCRATDERDLFSRNQSDAGVQNVRGHLIQQLGGAGYRDAGHNEFRKADLCQTHCVSPGGGVRNSV